MPRRLWLIGPLMLACEPEAATPIPEPPAFLDAGLLGSAVLEAEIEVAGTGYRSVTLVAPAGAATPGSTVSVVNLSDTGAPTATTALANGSFTIALGGRTGDPFRLIARADGGLSEPVDLVLEGAGVEPAPNPGCLVVGPASDITLPEIPAGTSDTLTVSLENRCDESATVRSQQARRGDLGVSLVEPLPTTVAAGATATAELAVAPTEAGPVEDHLVVTVTLGDDDYVIAVGVRTTAR